MIRWGVAGPGAIATGFAEAMKRVPGGEIVAVASRSMDRAHTFADRFAIARRYDDYEALSSDDEIDAVYVATPHSRHASDSLPYLRVAKAVLCEKPMALNESEVRAMVGAARERGVFLMEAMWSRFLPAFRSLGDVLASGRIGRPLLVEADFGFQVPFDPTNRHYDPHQGGGALLDRGIYPLQLCSLVLGTVAGVQAEAIVAETGVDETVTALLRHTDGGLGVIKASIGLNLGCTARIAGTEGVVEIPAFMHCPAGLTVMTSAGAERIEAPYEDGLRFEIEEVHRCIEAGLAESPDMPLDESVALAGVMDSIREQIGVAYPSE